MDRPPIEALADLVVSLSPFAERLDAAVDAKRSHLVVGLDPHLDELPAEMLDGVDDLAGAAVAAQRFCEAIIDGAAELAPVVKPQSAFFEQFGSAGLAALERVIDRARSAGLLVLEDAKRGDIGTTMGAYATALLGRLTLAGRELPVQDNDAVTISPYLGPESLTPILEVCDRYGKGVFVLVRTSNPASGVIQHLETTDGPLFAHVARMVAELGEARRGPSGRSSVGAVCGLTYPEDAPRLRALMPHATFLVPGLGAQGGRPEHFPAFIDDQGGGAIVAAARAVSGGWREEQTGPAERRVREGARRTAVALREQLDAALASAERRRW